MSTSTSTLYDYPAYDRGNSSRKGIAQNVFGGVGLSLIALTCVWTLYSNLRSNSADAPLQISARVVTVDIAESFRALAAIPPAPALDVSQVPAAVREGYLALMNPMRYLGGAPGTFAKPEQPKMAEAVPALPQENMAQAQSPVREAALSIPMPTRRPVALNLPESPVPARRDVAQANKAALLAKAPAEAPSIFEKLFGKVQQPGPMLAYAAPDGGVTGEGRSLSPGRYDQWTAVYDISARVVYLPDGTKLEAHSGLGSRLDDPRFVRERMRGATPPHLYDLTPREALFHGVPALRLNPVGGEGAIFGRSGLLAHTYMLGPNGDSNGCVSFRNYNAFLQAYRSGKVKRLAVVASLD